MDTYLRGLWGHAGGDAVGGVGCLGGLLHHLGHPRLRHTLRSPHLGKIYDLRHLNS